MSLPFPEVPSFDGSGFGNELSLLDIQAGHSRELQALGLHGQAVVKLVTAGMYPDDTMAVSSCVYENQHPKVPDMAFGGVALLGRDGQGLRPTLLGRMYVYSRFQALVLPIDGFTQAEAEATSAMAVDLRRTAQSLGIVLCPQLIEIFRTPAPGQPGTGHNGLPLR